MLEKLLDVDEVAGITQLKAATIRKYVLQRSIPFHKILKAVRFVPSEIEAWILHDGGCPVVKRVGIEGEEPDLFSVVEGEAVLTDGGVADGTD
jgi:predicted DNA-binding transcriptional regulator AlpA